MGALALILFLLISAPLHVGAINPGYLDDAWLYGMNYLINTSVAYGRDVVCSYGPLSYLLYIEPVGNNVATGLVILSLIHLLLAGILCSYLKASSRSWQFAAFIICLTLTCAGGVRHEYYLGTLFVLAAYMPLRTNEPKPLIGVLAGFLVPFLMAVKFNLGVAVFATFLLATFCWWIYFGARATRLLAASYASLVLSTAIFSIMFFNSARDAVDWLRISWEFASTYCAVHSLIDKQAPLALAVALVAVFAATAAWLLKTKNSNGLLALIAAPSLAVAFKHGFVRQDPAHEVFFFVWCLTLIACMGLATQTPRWRYWLAAFAVVFAMSSGSLVRAYGSPAQIAESLNPVAYVQHLGQLIDGSLVRDAEQKSLANCNAYRLPEDAARRIHRAGDPPVAVLPCCMGYAASNNLNWSPFPLIHVCNAESPLLDNWCAQHYTVSTGPEFVVFGSTADLTWNFGEIDQRIPTLEAPLTCNAIYCNYDLVSSYQTPEVALLRKRTAARRLVMTPLKQEQHRLNEWFAIPQSNGPLVAYIKLKPNRLAYALAKAYQLPPVMLDVASADKWRTYRVVPENFTSGLLLNCFPRTITELAQWMRGENPNRVSSVRIYGPGCSAFQKVFEIKWAKASFTPKLNYSATNADLPRLSKDLSN